MGGWGGKSNMDALQNIRANPIVEAATRNTLDAAERLMGLQSSRDLEHLYTQDGRANPPGWDPVQQGDFDVHSEDPFTYFLDGHARDAVRDRNRTGTTGSGLNPVGYGDDSVPYTDVGGNPNFGTGGYADTLPRANPYADQSPLPGMPTTPGFYPGSTVAGMSPLREHALGEMFTRGAGGSAEEAALRNFLGQNLGGAGGAGGLLGGLEAGQEALTGAASGQINPLVGNAFRQAAGDLTEVFNEQVLPGINATFASAGRTGGGLQSDALTNAAGELSDTLGGLAANMFGGAAESALDRSLAAGSALQQGGLGGLNAQLGAAGLVPTSSALDYGNINAMMGAGQGFEDFRQRLIDADRDRYEHESTRGLQDYQRGLESLGQYVGFTGPLQGTGTTQSSGSQQNKRVK